LLHFQGLGRRAVCPGEGAYVLKIFYGGTSLTPVSQKALPAKATEANLYRSALNIWEKNAHYYKATDILLL